MTDNNQNQTQQPQQKWTKILTACIAVVAIVFGVCWMNSSSRASELETAALERDQLLAERDTLLSEKQDLQNQLAQAQSDYSVLQEKYDELSGADPTPEASAAPEEKDPQSTSDDDSDSDYTPSDPIGTVYWTSGGEKYHSTKDCASLKRSKTIKSGSVSEAKSAGKSSPCKNCF